MDHHDEKVIYDYADKFISLAKDIFNSDKSGRVGMAIRYAAAQFSIFETAAHTSKLTENRDKYLQLFAEDFTKMLQFNLDKHLKVPSSQIFSNEGKMTERKSWDDIPSLNTELDDDEDLEEKEERRHPRTDHGALTRLLFEDNPFPVQILTTNKGQFEGMILDVSKSGIKLVAPKSLEQEERVKVSFTLSNRVISAKAVTCWTSLESNGFHIGLEFQDLPANIADFFDSLNTANLLDRVGKLKEGSKKNRT